MLKISLLENALDYVLNAANGLKEMGSDNTLLKYAIIHLWSGVELLLKKRLFDEHWSLIFRDVNKAKRAALESGDFISVYFDDTLLRLRDICNLNLDNHKEILNNLRKERNKLEHYEIRLSRDAAISKLVEVSSFIFDFCSSHLSFDEEPLAQHVFDRIKSIILFHEEFINSRLNEINPILRENEQKYYGVVVKCPECFQNTMLISDNEESPARCYFCNSSLPCKVAMQSWLSTWNTEGPFRCLECGDESLCRDATKWICFCCGRKWDFDELDRCADCETGVFSLPSNYNLCELCFSTVYD